MRLTGFPVSLESLQEDELSSVFFPGLSELAERPGNRFTALRTQASDYYFFCGGLAPPTMGCFLWAFFAPRGLRT